MTGSDLWAEKDPTACPVCGRDSCEVHLPPGDEPTQTTETLPRLNAQGALDLIQEAGPIEIVEGLAWSDSITILVSESGAGKTFTALDLAGAVSDGASWHGRETTKGAVVYVPYEGSLSLRLRALHECIHRRLADLYVIKARHPLSPRFTRDGETASLG